ncbi:Uncharacterised protein [Staphylococcus aureus]|nr:Uncharacterised protein [Staphylococcus aureus]CAC7013119.1 Uncharacterised protein [Staphylococcus aureus]SCU54764.1 Uncharacterised protein [Staphylococcus aureus]
MACLFGYAIFDAIAPGRPQPIVPNQLEMMNLLFTPRFKYRVDQTVAVPTSAEITASSLINLLIDAINRSGRNGLLLLFLSCSIHLSQTALRSNVLFKNGLSATCLIFSVN